MEAHSHFPTKGIRYLQSLLQVTDTFCRSFHQKNYELNCEPMSGHNRWSKVKRIKGPQDAKKGKMFTKIAKEIMVASRLGGGNPDINPRLRQALLLGREASMPKENMERAIKKGTGEIQGDAVEEIVYEGYGPGGVAILVETTTDNKNRTVSELRSIFKSKGGNLGEVGSVAWMFEKTGQLLFEREKHPEEKMMEVALEAGAKDILVHEDSYEVLTDTGNIYQIKDFFEKVGLHAVSAGFHYSAKSSIKIEKENAEKLIAFIDAAEDQEDVQKVHANFEIDEDIAKALA